MGSDEINSRVRGAAGGELTPAFKLWCDVTSIYPADSPPALGCLLALVRGVVGDIGLSCIGDGLPSGETRWCVEPSKLRSHNKWVMAATKDCWSEAEALVATLEAAGTKGLHLTPSADLSVRKPKSLGDSTLRKPFNSREG